MKFTLAEAIQIALGIGQLYFGYLAIKKQSEPQKESISSDKNGNFSFFNSIEKFDVFAFFISAGCLALSATLSLPSLLDWSERLARFTLLAMGSAVFTLTVIRIQANKLALIVQHRFDNLNIDGGEF
jgi:hypothetical protein